MTREVVPHIVVKTKTGEEEETRWGKKERGPEETKGKKNETKKEEETVHIEDTKRVT